MSKLIPLTKGQFAIVDDADYDWLMQWKWYCNKGYAARRIGNRCIPMHQIIMNTLPGMEVDHRNRNRLDNQRINLRPATRNQQTRNRSKLKPTSSSFKGVDWMKRFGKWRARIKLNRKPIHLGLFTTELEAALAYDNAARIYFGDFAATNF